MNWLDSLGTVAAVTVGDAGGFSSLGPIAFARAFRFLGSNGSARRCIRVVGLVDGIAKEKGDFGGDNSPCATDKLKAISAKQLTICSTFN